MRMGTREYYEERILHVQIYIQEHLDEDISLEDLAEVACFSPFHFHRIFRGMVGESVKEYVRRLRVERAALQLRHSERSIQDIAFDAGYENHASFTRIFRELFGMPPQCFRETFRNVPAITPEKNKYVITIQRPGGDNMNVSIKQFDEISVAFVRHVGPYKNVSIAWEKLCSDKQVIEKSGAGSMAIGICYDDPDVTDENKVRYDACVTVDDSFVPHGGIGMQRIQGGEYVVMVHKGSFDTLKDSYKRIYGQWLPGSGREVESGPSIEVYLKDPDKVPPEEMETEIRIPLKSIN